VVIPPERKAAARYVQPYRPTEKRKTKHQPFAKLKELQANAQADPNYSTFNFAQPHPSLPTTPTKKYFKNNLDIR
jgi:hypothetical protein